MFILYTLESNVFWHFYFSLFLLVFALMILTAIKHALYLPLLSFPKSANAKQKLRTFCIDTYFIPIPAQNHNRVESATITEHGGHRQTLSVSEINLKTRASLILTKSRFCSILREVQCICIVDAFVYLTHCSEARGRACLVAVCSRHLLSVTYGLAVTAGNCDPGKH